jgi:heme oxygenase
MGDAAIIRAAPRRRPGVRHHRAVHPLPDLLKDSTRDLHAQAERSGVMGALLAGRLPRDGYVRLLRHLHALYAALEARLDALPADPLLKPLALPGLRRAGALTEDVRALGAADDSTPLAPTLAAYRARLAQATPAQLAAQVYVRYLGDLNGGRVLARLVRQWYGPTVPVAFYDFGAPGDATALRDRLRAALAALPLAAGDAEAMAAEARWAFAAHCRLFEELAAA